VKVSITTLGCPKNTVDSAHLQEALLSEGFETVDEPESAEIILVNTCGFIRDAKEESVEEILMLAKIKNGAGSELGVLRLDHERTGETADTGNRGSPRKLVVFGCLAQRYRDELLREMPEIDALWGVGDDEKIVQYCKTLRDSQESKVRSHESGMVTRDSGRTTHDSRLRTGDSRPPTSSYAYLKIAEGCNKRCTFCVIPSIRGPFRSTGPERLLREAERNVRRGARELILVAQDITDYGRDLREYGLVPFLRDLSSIEGDFRIRLLYLYPTAITDALIEFVASDRKVITYLDIPLQHSEDRLLRLMGRRGTRKEYFKLLRRIRRMVPGVTLRTTFIVGFPTETEDEFNGLVDFIEEARFDRLGAFMYSREEGTAASLLKGQVPEKVKQRRLDELMRRQALISFEKNRDLVGRRFEALVEEVDEKLVIGRLDSQAPEIDGVTIIEESVVKSEESRAMSRDRTPNLRSPVAVGDLVTVEIVDAYDYDLKARLVSVSSPAPAGRQ
jgi:ribosomal protein S12 methylthiotransferase